MLGSNGLTVATFFAGILLVIMGVAKLGSMIKFIPHPVITGFTRGIALIIFSSQVKDLLGLRMGAVPAEFLPKWGAFLSNAGSFTPAAVGVSAATLAILVAWPRLSQRIPSPFVALVATTAAVQLMHLPVETIGTRFGALNPSVPHPQLPHLCTATPSKKGTGFVQPLALHEHLAHRRQLHQPRGHVLHLCSILDGATRPSPFTRSSVVVY